MTRPKGDKAKRFFKGERDLQCTRTVAKGKYRERKVTVPVTFHLRKVFLHNFQKLF